MKVLPHEQWIRLAQANVLMSRDEDALRVLSTAVSVENSSWQLWRNLAAISVKCMEFEKAAISYHKAVALNPLYSDGELLKTIVQSLLKRNLEPAVHSSVRSATVDLLRHLAKKFPQNPEYWSLLGAAVASQPQPDEVVRQESVKFHSKAVGIVDSPYNKWHTRDSEIVPVLKSSQLIVDCLVNASFLFGTEKEGKDCLKIATKYIDLVTERLENFHSDFLTKSVRSAFLNHYDLLKEKQSKIKSFLH